MSSHIHVPEVVKVEELDNNSASLTISPLHNGYGNTLGNSLRRVLLGSISGAAIVAFKVEGVNHEFTTINGVKEDLLDISLNLKMVRFRVYGEEKHQLRLDVKGKKIVKAKDITVDADVEVANPNQVICTMTDESAHLVMDMQVEVGRGYKTIEESTLDKPSDMVALDAIFSPVLRVRYKVENTRVGQATDLDKLIMTIDTDGTIQPVDAFEEAAAILINQYTSLAGKTRVALQAESEEDQAEAELASELNDMIGDEDQSLSTPIEELNLSARTTNALINNDIHTIKDLLALSEVDLKDLKGFGTKALDEVKDKISELDI